MSNDQRLMAVTLLANAIRKHEGSRREEPSPGPATPDLARLAGSRARDDATHQYVRGMVDLLAVLFEGGRPQAEACYQEALQMARGNQAPGASRPDLN
jgi:hypothetical protein